MNGSTDNGKNQSGEMSLAMLSECSGVPARTIRLYITKGLVPGPLRAGKNAAYGGEHLDRLRDIRKMQAEGLSLEQIRRELTVSAEPEPDLPCDEIMRFRFGVDVEVLVKPGADAWRMHRIKNALRQLGRLLAEEGKEHDDGDKPD